MNLKRICTVDLVLLLLYFICDRCALKLLLFFYTSEELSNSNTDGTHNKQQLDVTKLQALKVLVFSRFPIESATEKEKVWKSIKSKINSKCRLSKHVHKLARSS